jgi:anti-sigma B factor antagonist
MTSHEEPEQLTVDVDEPQPGVLVAQLTGWLDLATAPGAEIQLQELLDTRAPRSIVVDLSRTEFLGSAGVAVLLRLHRGALARGCEPPCLVGLSGTARRTLHGLGLLEMFSTADDVAAAMP